MNSPRQIAIDFAAIPSPPEIDTRAVSLPASLVTITEAARALGLGRSKTYELIAAGELEVVHIGRASRVPVEAIDDLVRRLRSRQVATQQSGRKAADVRCARACR